MDILRVEGLSKNFQGLEVLRELSFGVRSKEKLAIIGPNGAGKTTLFNVLGGQLPASSGSIYLLDQEITAMRPYQRLHLGLSRSYQINNLFDELSLLDNMILAVQGAESPRFRVFEKIDSQSPVFTEAKNLLDSLGLWEMRSVRVKSLSYGDQRLVEVAFGLASKPGLLMLDEPTAGLSTAEANAFEHTIKELLGNTPLLFTAHDMDLVFNLADRIMVLYSGGIIAQGSPDEIQEDPAVREIYLGKGIDPNDFGIE